MARKASKGESTKSEMLTVRINPKTKYGLELLARKHHRSLAGVVDWSLDLGLREPTDGLYKVNSISEFKDGKRVESTKNQYMLETLWHYDEVHRLIVLQKYWPELLTYEEEQLLSIILENACYWVLRDDFYPTFSIEKGVYYWNYCRFPDDFLLAKVKRDLPILKLILQNKAEVYDLPEWVPGKQYTGIDDTSYMFIDKKSLSKDQLEKVTIIDSTVPLSHNKKNQEREELLLLLGQVLEGNSAKNELLEKTRKLFI